MNTTAWILVILVFVLSAYDIYAAYRWGYEGTISSNVLMASYEYPIIAFAAGVICGHLFWSQGGKP